MKVSKFIKLERDILLEYIYDDGNLIGEDYKILVNIQDNTRSFISGDLSGTGNVQSNQLFQLDRVNNKYGLVDKVQYNFLQTIDYSGGLPIRHDKIKFHFPVNYTFGDKFGFYMKLYTFDYENKITYDLSNFHFDITKTSTSGLLNFTSPPFVFQETLWGKNIEISTPSIYTLSLQRDNGNAKANTINSNLTNNFGLSTTSPIFIDFHFLTAKNEITGVVTYNVNSAKTISIPQVPEFENLGVKIDESTQGDFFEIYGIFNGSIGGFGDFINKSFTLGSRYYVEYAVTLYEENIKGKTQVFNVTENFGEEIEYRPVIKFSTTTAVIDVEMRMIDAVDGSTILRRASYGMLQDQIAKYSLSLTKININNANKPKIYNLKGGVDINSLVKNGGLSNALSGFTNINNVRVEQVKVPYPVFQDRTYVVAKSNSVKIQSDVFYGIGKLQITIYPFDNVITMIIAENVNEDEIKYLDLNNGSVLKLVFKNEQYTQEARLFTESNEIDLGSGVLVFRIEKGQISDIRKIFNSGINVFYITSTSQNNSTTTIVYSGTFVMYDSNKNVTTLNEEVLSRESGVSAAIPTIIEDRDIIGNTREISTIDRRRILKDSLIKPPSIPVKTSLNIGNLKRK